MITTKINANIGASPVSQQHRRGGREAALGAAYGADTLMDLSTGGNLAACRQAIIDHSTIPIGTVPIYSMIIGRRIEDLTYDVILQEIERQAQQGVDYFTIHAGVLREHLPLIGPRVTGIVSRGGSLLAKWMIHHGKQNPMYELFDEISAIMREYDVTYSLGDGLRPGCLADATDAAQLAELHTLGELVQRARAAGVQVMVEGPGHVPLDQIDFNMQLAAASCATTRRSTCSGRWSPTCSPATTTSPAPSAPPRRRAHGAAMLCYVTPKEHVGLPKAEDVKAGCIAYKIAAHAGDIARGIAGARQWDDDLSRARAALNWPKQFELAFDGETARALHDEDLEVDTDFCAMCGHDWCSMRISKEIAGVRQRQGPGLPARAHARCASPGVSDGGPRAARRRARTRVPVVDGKHACHSDHVPDAERARVVQSELAAKE